MVKTLFVVFLLGLVVAASAVTNPAAQCYTPCETQFHECRKTNSKDDCCTSFKSCFKTACSADTFFCPPSKDDAAEGDDVWGMEGAFKRPKNE
ncbi:Hypothetical predicted protein [Octopus vulgaris]|uniref:Uncharacterized protein n=1 Tax=Octopus vulgaris TaxID=6645 RepID=A0AA36ANR1_OCTVU|nr:Hypothetical predicted protein [Octopus vulgaris]